jgi:hypothetical protein
VYIWPVKFLVRIALATRKSILRVSRHCTTTGAIVLVGSVHTRNTCWPSRSSVLRGGPYFSSRNAMRLWHGPLFIARLTHARTDGPHCFPQTVRFSPSNTAPIIHPQSSPCKGSSRLNTPNKGRIPSLLGDVGIRWTQPDGEVVMRCSCAHACDVREVSPPYKRVVCANTGWLFTPTSCSRTCRS